MNKVLLLALKVMGSSCWKTIRKDSFKY